MKPALASAKSAPQVGEGRNEKRESMVGVNMVLAESLYSNMF